MKVDGCLSANSQSLPRCEASNSANAMRPVSSSIRFNVFFEPRGLQIALERPDVDESKYDRAKAFKKEKKFNDDSYRIVMGGELVRLVCVTGIPNQPSVTCPTNFRIRGC